MTRFADMFIDPDADPRSDPPLRADERATLVGFLRWQRHTPNLEVVAQAWSMWRAEAEFTDRFVAEAPSLDITGDEPWRGPVSLRWVLVHLIEEYARHNGHADLIRQRIDGAVGQ